MFLARFLASPRLSQRRLGTRQCFISARSPVTPNVWKSQQKARLYSHDTTRVFPASEERPSAFDDLEFSPADSSMLRVTAVNLSTKRDLVGLISFFDRFGPEALSVALCSKKRSKDIPFIYVKVTQDSSLSARDPNSPYFLLWNGHDKHYLFFENGVVVGWGMTDTDFKSLEAVVSKYDTERLAIPISEQMNYVVGEKARIDTELDQLVITNQNQFDEVVLFSIGLSRSVKLEEIEVEVERAVSEVHQIKFNHIDMGHKKGANTCREKLAAIYHIEYKTTSRLNDEPDFLWDRPHSQGELFSAHCSYLGISNRLVNAKDRLKLPHSYWSLENKHFQLENGWRLEMIIIFGIFIEVVLHLLGKSKKWQEFVIEDYLSRFLVSLGLKPDTFSLDYDTIVEEEVTYEVVQIPMKRE